MKRSQHIAPVEDMGSRIRRLRDALGLEQAELGKAVGVGRVAVSRWETGVHEPRGRHLTKLADALQVPPHYIIYGEAGVYREAVEEIAAIVDRVLNPEASGDARTAWLHRRARGDNGEGGGGAEETGE